MLAASVYFYMAFVPVYILILIGTILVDYAAGFLIDGSQGRARKSWLIVSIVANVGVLVFFRYFNFVNDTFRTLTGFAEWRYPIPALDIILPIGLSFHTFQSMAYTIEVYRGHQPVERNLWRFALYAVLSPVGCRTDRAPAEFAPATTRQASLRLRPGEAWFAADGMGPVQKGGHRRSGRSSSGRGVPAPRCLQRIGSVGGDIPVRYSDLRGLLQGTVTSRLVPHRSWDSS